MDFDLVIGSNNNYAYDFKRDDLDSFLMAK